MAFSYGDGYAHRWACHLMMMMMMMMMYGGPLLYGFNVTING